MISKKRSLYDFANVVRHFFPIRPRWMLFLPSFSGILLRFSQILPRFSPDQNFWGCTFTPCLLHHWARHKPETACKVKSLRHQEQIQGGDCPPATYESNFIHHDIVQFRKRHSRYEAILPSIVLSQQCCEVCFISLTEVNPRMRLDYQILLKSLPLNLLAGSAQVRHWLRMKLLMLLFINVKLTIGNPCNQPEVESLLCRDEMDANLNPADFQFFDGFDFIISA